MRLHVVRCRDLSAARDAQHRIKVQRAAAAEEEERTAFARVVTENKHAARAAKLKVPH